MPLPRDIKGASRAKQRIPYGREYIVSKTEGPFFKIQRAIDKAKADGFGPGKPCLIRVFPGSFTEDLVLEAGVDIRAVAPYPQSFNCDEHTELIGLATYATTDTGGSVANVVVIDGLSINPKAGKAIDFVGGESQTLIVRNATICGSTSGPKSGSVYLENTFATGTNPGDRSRVQLENCIVVELDQLTDTRAVYGKSGDFRAFETFFGRGDGADNTVIQADGSVLALSDFFLDDNCLIFGAFEQTSSGTVALRDAGDHSIRNSNFSPAAAAIICGQAGSIRADNLDIDISTASLAVVQGGLGEEENSNLFIWSSLTYQRVGKGISSLVRQILNMEVPANRYMEAPVSFGATSPSPNDFVTIVGDPAIGSTIRLPATGLNSTVPSAGGKTALPGTVVEVKEEGGGVDGQPLTAPITVTGDTGVEPVDGGVAFDFQSYGQYAKFTVNEAGTGWLVSGEYSKSGTVVATFLDNITEDLVVGTFATDAALFVHLSLYQPSTGLSTAYKVTISASDVAIAFDVLQVNSDKPIITVAVSALRSGADILIRLTGSGAGTSTDATYKVLDTFSK